MKSYKCVLTTALPPVLAMVSLLIPGFVQAVTTTYNLSNHPGSGDGLDNETTTQFGLRLDGLLGGGENENYVFDFDHASSSMQLVWDDVAQTIVISGTAFGGVDDGLGGLVGGTTDVWTIDMTYDEVVPGDIGPVGGTFDDHLVGNTGPNTGTLSSTLFGDFTLVDHYSVFIGAGFVFGDNPDVSQGFGVLSGWGWLDYCNSTSCTPSSVASGFTNDWIFEATVVPVPAAVWLFGSGLIGLIAVARRKK